MTGKTNTDKKTNIWTDMNGEVKMAVSLSKQDFSNNKLLQAHVQYVLKEPAKYQNFMIIFIGFFY